MTLTTTRDNAEPEREVPNFGVDEPGFEIGLHINQQHCAWAQVGLNFGQIVALTYPHVHMGGRTTCETIDGTIASLSALLPEGSRVIRTERVRNIENTEILAIGDKYAVRLDYRSLAGEMYFQVAAETSAIAEAVSEYIEANFPAPEDEHLDETDIRAWNLNRDREAHVERRSIKTSSWNEVARNYASLTRKGLDDLMSFIPTDDPDNMGKIIIWHGPPGTGKTTALRTLVREWNEWAEAELLVDAEDVFLDPNYLFDIMGKPPRRNGKIRRDLWRLLIAEDADLYVGGHQSGQPNPALDRLLNLGDGLLGQGQRLLILLTTNVPVTAMSEALTRPGRCLSINEFSKFSPTEARNWLDEDIRSPTEKKSLAELFELQSDVQRIVNEVQWQAPGIYL